MFKAETKILIVDDMSTMRLALREQLKRIGFNNFIECQNGDQAFNVLDEQIKKKDPVQLVLTDWCMPLMSGVELVKKMRETIHLKSLPVLLVTAERTNDNKKEALDMGANGFLAKPFTADDLKSVLTEIYTSRKKSA
ncbi:MAG: response regulator [Bdellovibrionota bacterium]